MKTNKVLFILIGLIGLIGLFACAGQSYASGKDEAKALLNRAAAYVTYQGKGKALAEISKPKGMFDKGEMYVFAYDLQGVMLAHPKDSTLVGKNLYNIPDSEGKMFRKEIVDKAKKKGSGWVDYQYWNPETNEMEHKTTYLLKVGDIILCSGAYREYSHEGD